MQDLEVRRHGCEGSLATHAVCYPGKEIWAAVVDDFGFTLGHGGIADCEGCDARFDGWMLVGPECNVIDAKGVPDVLAHVVFKADLGEAFDDETGPVDAAAIVPVFARFKEERVDEAGYDRRVGVSEGDFGSGVVFLMKRGHRRID